MKNLLVTAAIASVALLSGNVDAATHNFGILGPSPSVGFETFTAPGPIDDFFTFTLSSATPNVDAYGEEFDSRSVNMINAEFALFSGSPGSGTQIGSTFGFSNVAAETLYTGLAPGAYYFEVTGLANRRDAAYDFEAFASRAAIPEPAGSVLLIAGIGLVGAMVRRRQQP
jgi:PEP-CTERM motif